MATWCHGNCNGCQVSLTADAAGTVAAGVSAEDFLTIFFDPMSFPTDLEFSNCDQVDKRSCLFETV